MDKLKLSKVLENRNLLDLLMDPVVIVDKDRKLLYYNYHYINMTGLSPREIREKHACSECFALDICQNNCVLDECEKLEQPVQLREVAAKDRAGNQLSLWINAIPLYGEDEKFKGALIVLRDMTVETGIHTKYKALHGREKDAKVRLEETVKERTEQLRRANIQLKLINKKLESLSLKDDLTDLFNYRYFSGKIDELFQEAQRDNKPLSCLLIDVDFFKSVNDNHSHQFGDFALYKLGVSINSALREEDILARYGGDEFVILLPHTDYDGSVSLAKDINYRVRNEIFSDGEFSTKVTISIGVSSFPQDKIEVKDQLVKFADEALYNAKRTGRNTVCCYKDIGKI